MTDSTVLRRRCPGPMGTYANRMVDHLLKKFELEIFNSTWGRAGGIPSGKASASRELFKFSLVSWYHCSADLLLFTGLGSFELLMRAVEEHSGKRV